MAEIDQQTVTVNAKGSIPDAEIYFGQGQVGRFDCYFQDEAGHQTLVKSGGTAEGSDVIPFSVGRAADELQGNYLCWDVVCVSPSGGVNEQYLVMITIRQDGSPIKAFQESGPMMGAYQSLLIYVRFQ